MRTMSGVLGTLPPDQREQLRALGRDVAFAAGDRMFEEGGRADRFWIIHTGSVTLDMHVPGRRAVVIDSLGHGELVGWSWMFPPFTWQMGGEAASPVRALQFEADTVRALCERDRELGHALTHSVAGVIGQRLQRSRTRLIDLFGPYALPSE
ncbi:Crp/Fnr family transcriptional regulator [Streptomyces sp. NPDC054796]|uniref:Cyclic nucleotide-binding domain-containing protein n=1 Tax=Streptomyces daliensis TaxID=299421 RepID=A0A8T4J2U2_9ACTN|nr:cyclic nucleotide-binding domain-containing protein [Streptomyces daliensis]